MKRLPTEIQEPLAGLPLSAVLIDYTRPSRGDLSDVPLGGAAFYTYTGEEPARRQRGGEPGVWTDRERWFINGGPQPRNDREHWRVLLFGPDAGGFTYYHYLCEANAFIHYPTLLIL